LNLQFVSLTVGLSVYVPPRLDQTLLKAGPRSASQDKTEITMETDLIEMMTFCIALLDHLGGMSEPLAGLDIGAITAAQSELTEAVGMLAQDPADIDAALDDFRPVVAEMPAMDMQEAAAFCLEMAE